MSAIFQPFIERIARVTVQVTRNDATGKPAPLTYVFEQHRMRIQVRQGGNQYGNAHVEVFGVKLSTMNQIARLWLESLTPQNSDTILIEVWDGLTFVPFFQGVITWSAVDASGMPHVKLVLDANSSMPLMNTPVSPYTNAGPLALSDVLRGVAQSAGFALDYSPAAPTYQVSSVRLTGSPLQQVAQILKGYPALVWDVRLQRLVVWQANAPYGAGAIRIATDTGMIAAPVYSTSGLQIATLFNPRIRPGAGLDVETQFDYVNRTQWVTSVLAHILEPNVPGGQWTTSLAATSFGAKNNT